MASGMVNPRPIAPKPAAPKTSYSTPAVIAKPTATKPAAASSNFTYGSGNPQYKAPTKKLILSLTL